MATITTIEGLAALDRTLAGLGRKLENKIRRKALRKAAKPVQATAQQLAPRDEGKLVAAIKVRALKRNRRHPRSVGVRVVLGREWFRGDEFYAAFVELGYHVGRRQLGPTRRAVAPRPFMRPAYEQNKPVVREIFRRECALLIAELASEAPR